MKTLFIGDIHGRIEIIEYIDKNYPDHQKVFVGDFVDAYDRTRGEQLSCIRKVLSMIDRGDTKAIFGNHELSYLSRDMRCSGWAGTMDAMLLPLKSDMWKKFDYYLWYPKDKILVTHAGLSNTLWKLTSLTFENLIERLEEWKKDPFLTSINGWIGKSRGGMDPVGGIFWCDWYDEFQPIDGLKQVLGHSGYISTKFTNEPNGIRFVGDNYNIDCLTRKLEFLEYDDETSKLTIRALKQKEDV